MAPLQQQARHREAGGAPAHDQHLGRGGRHRRGPRAGSASWAMGMAEPRSPAGWVDGNRQR